MRMVGDEPSPFLSTGTTTTHPICRYVKNLLGPLKKPSSRFSSASCSSRGHRASSRSLRTAIAALRPLIPITLPPG